MVYRLFVLLLLNWSCTESSNNTKTQSAEIQIEIDENVDQNILGNVVKKRFLIPQRYSRVEVESNSFGEYLRNLKLKPAGSLVKYFDGSTKSNYDVYEAVVDMTIGNKDLHQCADAVMRLRAEYLWENKRYNQIHFNFTNGHKVEYKEWMNGKKMNIKGNKTWWTQKTEPSNTYNDFWKYMELIFTYAGTASLEKELKSISLNEAKIGDVLIQGGYSGHAVIIIDKAFNDTTGESIYLLAQSYMPAQEIQILKNPTNSLLSPWYKFEEGEIYTPEWTFKSDNLRRFVE